jgi:hypothetical protein
MLALGAASTAVAQDVPDWPGIAEVGSNPGNAVQVDLGYLLAGLLGGGFGIGGAYERAITDQISVKGIGGFLTWPIAGYTFIDAYGEGRYYIFPTALNGPFVGGGAGATLATFDDGVTTETYFWPGILLEAGYKYTFGEDATSGFFGEAFVGFQSVFGSITGYGGFNYGFGLGYAF